MSPFPTPWTAAALLAALCVPSVRAAEPQAPDPVEEFHAALLQPLGPGGATDRKADLQKRLDAVETPGQLAGALTFDFWAEEQSAVLRTDAEKAALECDKDIFGLLAKKFVKRLHEALKAADPEVRAAAAILVATMASAEREHAEANPFYRHALFPRDSGPAPVGRPFTELTADLGKRTRDEDARVRRAAVQALAELHSDPPQTTAELSGLLSGDQKDKDPSVRRAAAAALGNLLETAGRENGQRLGLDQQAEAAFIRFSTQAVAPAAGGLGDEDAEVRRLCLVALRRAADALKDLTEIPWSGPTNDADPQIQVDLKHLREETELLRNLADALNSRLPAATGALADGPEVSVAASELLEAVAAARSFMRRWEAALPPEKADAKPPADRLPALLDAREPLAKSLSAKEVRVRLAAVYVLESLGPEAAPAVAALAKALAKDPDPFVRWGAARALGKMAPHPSDAAVEALGQALEDKNEDVRFTAAVALGRFGPAAKGAVAALAAAVKRDDGARLEALKTLAAVGVGAAQAAGEAAAALADPDAEVRVAAANALARMGPLDPGPREVLRGVLNDPDNAVRQAAAAAILSGK